MRLDDTARIEALNEITVACVQQCVWSMECFGAMMQLFCSLDVV